VFFLSLTSWTQQVLREIATAAFSNQEAVRIRVVVCDPCIPVESPAHTDTPPRIKDDARVRPVYPSRQLLAPPAG
jgi:hypothetical protein